MLGVDHDKNIILSTPFPTIPMLGTHCWCTVIVFYVGNKRCCIVLYCIVLYCIVLYCIVLYCIVLYCIVLYCIVLYCIVLYCVCVSFLYCVCLIKKLIPYIFVPLKHIFNISLLNGVFPDSMKIARVIPLFKSGNTKEFSNYRPISL